MSSSSALQDSDRSLGRQSAPDTPIVTPKMTPGACPRAAPKAASRATLKRVSNRRDYSTSTLGAPGMVAKGV